MNEWKEKDAMEPTPELLELKKQFEAAKKEGEQREIMKEIIHSNLLQLIKSMRNLKPDERNEEDRRFAIVITDLEKVLAYYETFIAGR